MQLRIHIPIERSFLNRWRITDTTASLEDQFFQTLTAIAGFLCIFVITPINYLQNLSAWINWAILGFGLVSLLIARAAGRGRFYKRTLLIALVGLLDLIWFPNCGTQGSVGLYFFAAALLVVVFFNGPQRILGLLLLVVNVVALLVVERAHPSLTSTFSTSLDRLIDLASGYVISVLICSLILWVIQSGFVRERVRANAVLRTLSERERELRAVFDSSQQAVGVFKNGVLELANQSFVRLFRSTSVDRLVGVPLPQLIAFDAGDGESTGRSRPDSVSRAPGVAWEVQCKRPDGTYFSADLSLSSYETYGSMNTVVGLTDLTERKRAEQQQRQYEAQARRNEKMDSLGALAGGVAHDMNNVLTAVMGLASVQLTEASPRTSLHKDMTTIVSACQRGSAMVKGLLAFARDNLPVERDLDLNALVKETVALLERTTLQRIRLQVELAEDLAPMRGDPSALSHALMNLCVNSIDAMPDGGSLTLRTHNHDPSGIVLEISDTGSGMEKSVLDRVLEPFFTTKPMGKGTGLGLPIVFGTVKAHHGRMEIHSEPRQGTRVLLFFPAQTGHHHACLAAGEPQSIPPVRTQTILLVDDDELVQHAVHRILRSMGHTVTAVSGGLGALAAVEAGLRPDLVILDMNMPDLDGAATLPRLRAIMPEVPVVLATGRADERATDLASSYPNVTILPKPFEARELGSKVVRVGQRQNSQ